MLETPDAALDQAFAWAVGRGSPVRAEEGRRLADWDASDLSHLLLEARGFRRVGAAALQDPDALIQEIVAGLFGVSAGGEGGRYILAPWLPEGWRKMALRRLRCHRTLLDIEVRPRAEWAIVRLAVLFGPPIAVELSLRNAGAVSRLTVDDVALEGERAIFVAQSEHEVMIFHAGGAR
ncbi:MAG: hypothetical protein HOP28_09640 [Gemmatimonadales bacterium]|nr:hypothetical protein [Gemmatimonadales bacterium]